MNAQGHELLEDYLQWLRASTRVRDVSGFTELTVPFLDRHNDHLQVYIGRSNGDYVLTDDGYTIADLEQAGCRLTSPKRRELLAVTLNGFGVKLDEGALVAKATSGDVATKTHNLIQAMLAVNDLFYLAEPILTSLFVEDVAAWLSAADVRFTPAVKFTGKSGYDYRFDFVVPASRRQPERVIRAINHPTRDAAQTLAFAWVDTREARSSGSVAYALLNDAEAPVPSAVTDALAAYDVRGVPWSKRDSVEADLAA